MNKMTKMFLAGAIALGITGCTFVQIPSPTDPTFNQAIQANRDLLKNDTFFATNAFLLGIKDQEKRKETAKKLFELAESAQSVLNTEFTGDDLATLFANFLAQNNTDDGRLTVLLVQSLVARVQNQLDFKFKLDTSEVRLKVAKELGLGVVAGVQESTRPYIE